MILGDNDLKQLHRHGHIECPDGYECLIGPASVDARLGNTFLVPKRKLFGGIHLGCEVQYKQYRVPDGKEFCLLPGQFALATTLEYFVIPPNMAAFVQGRSSIGRAGLSVQNAGFIDPGFYGHITLELKNETRNTIYLSPGYPVTQIVFNRVTSVEKPYSGKYNGQVEATGSRMFMDKV